ncbi:MAG: glycosyltransferase family 4 protein [Candidatus Eremiobacteraeota bacterium]|nr:glycosyltransferase family 4 protein [Candidatus Eremiobacteraeota bacterium]
MRVLILAERLGGAGGTERYLETLIAGLRARGDDVLAVGREQLGWADEHAEPSMRAATEAVAIVREFAPDVAIAENVMDAAVVEALRSARQLTYHVHDHRPFCPNGDRVFPHSQRNCTLPLGAACVVNSAVNGCAYGPRPKTLELIRARRRLRDAIRRADRILVASRYVADRATASGIPRALIATVPIPLPGEAYAAAVTPSNERAIMFAGRVVPQKGLAALVRALATIAPGARPRLRVLGEGPALQEAIALAGRLGVTLETRGSVGPAEVRAALDQAALLALPSLWAEPFGSIGIEAFARGRPVVAFAAGGIGDWLHDGINGLAVRPRDERGFGAAISRILDDAALRARLGAQARQDAETFRIGNLLERLV